MNHELRSLPGWPQYDQDEIDAVSTVMRSGRVNYWTGDEGKSFEIEFASRFGCKYAIALANGTVALELALYSMGIGPGDEVVVPCYTFIATASAVVARGATPVMADVDPDSFNITADTVSHVLTDKTTAIITVHLAGRPCDMDPIRELANQKGLKIIEDCAQAHGAMYKGEPVGSIGDVGTFSFCQDKIMSTCGEGGMLVTNNEDCWSRAWSYKDHGKSYQATFEEEHPIGFKWLHESFGTNWRMTEIQAAVGRLQLKKLSKWVEKRRFNASLLDSEFSEINALRILRTPKDCVHSYYKYYMCVEPKNLAQGTSRDSIMRLLNSAGVPCTTGCCPEIYLEKAFFHEGKSTERRLPNAKALGEVSLVLQVHPTLTGEDMRFIAGVVKNVVSSAAT